MCLMNYGTMEIDLFRIIEEISLQKQNTTLTIITWFWIRRIRTEFCFVGITGSFHKKKIITPNRGFSINNVLITYYIIREYFPFGYFYPYYILEFTMLHNVYVHTYVEYVTATLCIVFCEMFFEEFLIFYRAVVFQQMWQTTNIILVMGRHLHFNKEYTINSVL